MVMPSKKFESSCVCCGEVAMTVPRPPRGSGVRWCLRCRDEFNASSSYSSSSSNNEFIGICSVCCKETTCRCLPNPICSGCRKNRALNDIPSTFPTSSSSSSSSASLDSLKQKESCPRSSSSSCYEPFNGLFLH